MTYYAKLSNTFRSVSVFSSDSPIGRALVLELPDIGKLPEWEPSWVATEVIDRVLTEGQETHDIPWFEEATNLIHARDHLQAAQMLHMGKTTVWPSDQYAAYVEELEHLLTRTAMEIARLRRLASPGQSPPTAA